MKTNVLKYNVLIKKEGKYYVADVPTLGISDFGKTIELAKKNVKGAIECHIDGLIKTGFEVPPPDVSEVYLSQTEVILPKAIRFAF